jgi:membrane protease YdiL (CAAX protease family)
LESLAFVAPLIAIYELGIIALGPEAIRNGCDVWLRQFLQAMGFSQYFLLPVMTCFCLLAWQHLSRRPWVVRREALLQMAWESLLFAGLLLMLSRLHGWCCHELALKAENEFPADVTSSVYVAYIGAGIYEELLFRLLLIPPLAGILMHWGESCVSSWCTAALCSSLLFAAAHYHVFAGTGEYFLWSTFVFRLWAGILFAGIFWYRGFGVSAGAHVLYDFLAGSMARD